MVLISFCLTSRGRPARIGRADLSRQPGDWPGQDPRARLPVRALSSGRVTACPGNRIPSRRDSSSRGYSWPFEAERGGKLQVTRG